MTEWRSGASKPVVALDIDGTMGDYHRHFLNFAAGYFGRPMPDPEEARHGVRLSEFIGVPHREYRDCKLAYRQGGMKRTMPAYPFALQLTHNIRQAGALLWICTTRPYLRLDNVDPDTREWLRRNEIEYDAILFEGIDGESKYADLVSQVGLGRIIAVCDDLPEQVKDAEDLGIGQVYLRDQPYNRAVPGPRVKSLEELWECLEIDISKWNDIHWRETRERRSGPLCGYSNVSSAASTERDFGGRGRHDVSAAARDGCPVARLPRSIRAAA